MVVLSLTLIVPIFPDHKPANHENIQNGSRANKRYRALLIACSYRFQMPTIQFRFVDKPPKDHVKGNQGTGRGLFSRGVGTFSRLRGNLAKRRRDFGYFV